MKLNIINNSGNDNPKYSNENDVGLDLRAYLDTTIVLLPFKRVIVPTGIHIDLPKGYQAEIKGRSGLAVHYGIGVLGGIIDPNYHDSMSVILVNHGQDAFHINNGDRIAQLVISKFESVELNEVDEFTSENRGGGLGHTGVK